MILIDTSVWINHFRSGDQALARLLERGEVLAHPGVTGELALGRLRNRAETIHLLGRLPQATCATPAELLAFAERHELFGLGIGYVDAHLIAATKLTDQAQLWTRDRLLRAAAERLDAAYAAR